jgi:hypothetical protein
MHIESKDLKKRSLLAEIKEVLKWVQAPLDLRPH